MDDDILKTGFRNACQKTTFVLKDAYLGACNIAPKIGTGLGVGTLNFIGYLFSKNTPRSAPPSANRFG